MDEGLWASNLREAESRSRGKGVAEAAPAGSRVHPERTHHAKFKNYKRVSNLSRTFEPAQADDPLLLLTHKGQQPYMNLVAREAATPTDGRRRSTVSAGQSRHTPPHVSYADPEHPGHPRTQPW